MQPAYALGRFNVDWVLRFDKLRLVACDKAERFDVLIQVFKLRLRDGLYVEIMQTKALKVTHHHLAQNITFIYTGKYLMPDHIHSLDPYR